MWKKEEKKLNNSNFAFFCLTHGVHAWMAVKGLKEVFHCNKNTDHPKIPEVVLKEGSLKIQLPWYNRTGWLGVKHQVTLRIHQGSRVVIHIFATRIKIMAMSTDIGKTPLLYGGLVSNWILMSCQLHRVTELRSCVKVEMAILNSRP